MDFRSYLEISAKDINEHLDLIFAHFLSEVKQTNIKLLPFAKKFINSNKGGKRIRGVLCGLGFELVNSKNINYKPEVLKIAAALEILHTALLTHDDIMDKSLTRRGQQTLYRALGGNHYGISQAINIGDIGLYLPVKIITDLNLPAGIKMKVLRFLSKAYINTCWGQILDIKKSADIEFIRTYKTAKYTFSAPLQIGAIVAGAKLDLLAKLDKFGENLGIAFQIRDDILDKEVESVNSAKDEELEYILKAKKLIPEIARSGKMVNLLEEMTEYLVQRTK